MPNYGSRRHPTCTCVRVQSSDHWTPLPRSILRAGAVAEEVAVRDRGLSDVGLCGLSEAARGCQDSSSGTAALTGPPVRKSCRSNFGLDVL